MYRLRSLHALLGDCPENGHQELEKQHIYFAPHTDLNDPLEGSTDVIWHGDKIVWMNFFRHYLLCLDYRFTMACFYKPDDPKESRKFFDTPIGVFITEKNLPSDIWKKSFREIKERFFEDTMVTMLIEYLSNRKTPVQQDTISVFLRFIQLAALKSVISVHIEKGTYPNTDPFNLPKGWGEKFNETLKNVLPAIKDFDFDIISRVTREVINEMDLIALATNFSKEKNINWGYFLIDFPDEYLRQVTELVYGKWFAASFLPAEPTDTAMWSHYADNHKGVCLIFKTIPTERGSALSLKYCNSTCNGSITGYNQMHFQEIRYQLDKPVEIDFFRSIFALPRKTLIDEWYTGEDGNTSICIDAIKNFDESKRVEYWERLRSIQSTKHRAWEKENEHRLVINNGFHDFSKSKEERTFEYMFSDLEGIIFGIKTPADKKVEIIRIIGEKCIEHTRNGFKIYQAKFDHAKGKIVFDELNLLRFKIS